MAHEKSAMGVTIVTPNHTQFTYLVRAFFYGRD
jgi:hypothetical protein